MKRRKVISTALIVLSVFAVLIAVAGLRLMSAIDKNCSLIDNAEDYADREQVTYGTPEVTIRINSHWMLIGVN